MAASTNCDPCQEQGKQTKGKNWCPNCEETLCEVCTAHHRSSKALRTHKIVDISLISELPSDISKLQFCDRHDKFNIEYFCTDHDAILCHACLAEGHRSCKEVVALDIACANSKILEETSRETQHIVETSAALRREIKTNSSMLDEESNKIEDEIELEKSKVIDRLNQLKKSLITKLHNTKDEKKQKVQMQLEKIEDINNEAEKRLKQMQFTEAHGTEKQAFLLAHKLRKFLTQTEESLSQMTLHAKTIKLQYTGIRNLESSISTLGNISETEKESSVKYSPLKQQQAQFIREEQKPLETFQVAYRFSTICKNVTGMIATNDNNLLLCDNETGVIVYTENGQHVKAIITKQKPFDIAFIPGTDQYVVTLPYYGEIQFIGSDMTAGKVVRTNCTFVTRGVAATNRNIYIGENNKILELNINGDELKEIHLETEFNFVEYITTHINDKLAAVDNNGSMFCISSNGKCSKYKKPNRNFYARKLVVDKQDRVYCADRGSDQIYRFTSDMKCDKTISDPSLKKFSAICFSLNYSKLFVANENGTSIVVFNCT